MTKRGDPEVVSIGNPRRGATIWESKVKRGNPNGIHREPEKEAGTRELEEEIHREPTGNPWMGPGYVNQKRRSKGNP